MFTLPRNAASEAKRLGISIFEVKRLDISTLFVAALYLTTAGTLQECRAIVSFCSVSRFSNSSSLKLMTLASLSVVVYPGCELICDQKHPPIGEEYISVVSRGSSWFHLHAKRQPV